MKFEAEVEGRVIPVEVTGEAGRYRVTVAGETLEVDARRVGESGWSLLLGTASHSADLSEEDGVTVVSVDGEVHRIRVEEETRYLIRTRGGTAAAQRPGAQGPHARARGPHRGHGGAAGEPRRRARDPRGDEDGERVPGQRGGDGQGDPGAARPGRQPRRRPDRHRVAMPAAIEFTHVDKWFGHPPRAR